MERVFTVFKDVNDMPIFEGSELFMEPYVIVDQSLQSLSFSESFDPRNLKGCIFATWEHGGHGVKSNKKHYEYLLSDMGSPRLDLHQKVAVNVFGSFYVIVVGLDQGVYLRRRGSTVLELLKNARIQFKVVT